MNIIDVIHEHESEESVAAAKECFDVQETPSEQVLMNRVQVVLAEKRTSLSVLRTGIGLLTLPMTIVAFLITTSDYWSVSKNIVFLVPLFAINTALAVMGFILIVRAWKRIRNYDRAIELIKSCAKTHGYAIP